MPHSAVVWPLISVVCAVQITQGRICEAQSHNTTAEVYRRPVNQAPVRTTAINRVDLSLAEVIKLIKSPHAC